MSDSTKIFTIGTRDQLNRVATAFASHAPHYLPLVRAARDCFINLVQPMRSAHIQKRILETRQRPIVVIIGDDDYASTGPTGWACAKRLRYWGRGAVIHSAGAEMEHYQLAASMTVVMQRFILVETDSAHQDEWARWLAPRMPIMGIRAPEGIQHPRMPSGAAVN